MKKLLLVICCLILLPSFISATLNDSEYYYSFDNDTLVGSLYIDQSGNGINATETDMNTNILGKVFDAVGNGVAANDRITLDDSLTTASFSIDTWIKRSATATSGVIYNRDGGVNGRLYFSTDELKYLTDAGNFVITSIENTNWNHVVVTYDGSRFIGYLNNVAVYNDTVAVTGFDSGDVVYIGDYVGADSRFIGTIDEFGIYSRALSASEVNDSWNGGNGTNPYTVPPVPPSNFTLNESLENTFQSEQVGSVTINSAAFINVLNVEFNSSKNTSSYFSSTFSLVSGGNSVAECRVLVDGIDYNSSKIRSMTPGDIASVYLNTQSVNISSGNHTADLQCRRASGGNFQVNSTVLIGHLLYDENLNNLVHKPISFNVTLIDSEVILSSTIFTTSNVPPDGVHNSTIVVNWDANYLYDANGGRINSFIRINDTECGHFPRSGDLGDSGSVGGDCVLINAGLNKSFNISFYGNGTGSISANVHIKEFITDEGEVNFSNLNNTEILSDKFQVLNNIFVNDTDHITSDLFVKVGIPHKSNNGSSISDFLLQLDGASNSSMVMRKLDGDTGVTIVQYLFSDVGVGSHNVSLLGRCTSGNCTIEGGTFVAYFSGHVTTVTLQSNVSVVDDYNGSSINVFNVTTSEGNTFSAVDGGILVSSNNALENLTISSDNYISRVVLNHNMSTDLNISLWQSVITFNAFKKVTLDQVLNFSVNDSVKSDSTVNGSAILKLPSGNDQVVSFSNVLGFGNITASFNVSSLDVKTVNISGLFDSLVNLSVFNFTLSGVNESGVKGFFGTVNSSANSFSESFNVSGNSTVLNLTQGVTYQFYVSSRPNFTISNSRNFVSAKINASVQNVSISIPHDQSILASFRDSVTNNFLENVTINLIGADNFTFSNVDSRLFAFNLTVGSYTFIASKTGFSSFSTNITVLEGKMVELTAFMNNQTSPIDFIVRNVAGGFISSARVAITRQSDNALIGEKFTDVFGGVQFNLNDLIVYNINVTRSGFTPFFGTLNAFQGSYTITLSTPDVNQQGFIGLDYQFLPNVGAIIVNDTNYNFSFNISSDGYWSLTSCNFSILNGSINGNVLASNSSFCSVSSGFTAFDFDTGNFTSLVSRAVLVLNSTNTITVFRFYSVNNDFQGRFTLMTLFDDLLSFDGAGFGSAALFFLTVIVIIGITLGLGSKLNVFGEPEKMLLFSTLLTGLASFVGLLTVEFTPAAFPEAGQWIIFIVMGLLTIASYISSGNWRLS